MATHVPTWVQSTMQSLRITFSFTRLFLNFQCSVFSENCLQCTAGSFVGLHQDADLVFRYFRAIQRRTSGRQAGTYEKAEHRNIHTAQNEHLVGPVSYTHL